MLRLWPETLSVGLFPGQCWLDSRSIQPQSSLPLALSTDPQALLRALESMLDEKGAFVRKGSNVVISVSDNVGALVTLPWQEELRTQEELLPYAAACFEHQGVVLDDHWIMRTEFRRHRATGIAYALPLAWLSQLLDVLRNRGLRLKRILPISASAYCNESIGANENRRLILLQETYRTSALIYNNFGLVSIDVEPVVSTPEISGMRLLKRINARISDIHHVSVWTPQLTDQAPSTDFLSACLPHIKVQRVVRDVWN